MPIRDSRYDNIKVHRPNGSRYAQGASTARPAYGRYWIGTGEVISMAVNGALRAFESEFGEPPSVELLIIEVVCSDAGATATVIEIKEPEVP
jgi:hypothetical protein